MNLQLVISNCQQGDRKAQRYIFETYSPKMLGLCRRYMKDLLAAEDIMIKGFYKVFTKISGYSGKGNFEGWMRRIMINEALMELRKQRMLFADIDGRQDLFKTDEDTMEKLIYEDLLGILDELPQGYRTIFNLYVIEGYKHREIAEILGISINTSKSQLILAKKRLREIIKKKQNLHKLS